MGVAITRSGDLSSTRHAVFSAVGGSHAPQQVKAKTSSSESEGPRYLVQFETSHSLWVPKQ